jgi:hypothetical protein
VGNRQLKTSAGISWSNELLVARNSLQGRFFYEGITVLIIRGCLRPLCLHEFGKDVRRQGCGKGR